jgi:Ras-related protein Rab-1A
MKENQQIMLKTVFVGDTLVGKTSLLTREADNCFHQQWICTIGCDFKIKTYKVGNVNVKAQYWDTAGQ